MNATPAACPPECVAAILGWEGIDQPSRWPGNSSGITLGAGYDLGYTPIRTFQEEWKAHLSPDAIARLSLACGKKGSQAAAIARQFKDITITKAAALDVFTRATLPRWQAETGRAFPGIHLLPPVVQGTLVSLVFNRGSSFDGPRRLEMRTIRAEIAKLSRSEITVRDATRRIATAISAMQRLWPSTPGLQRRRREEAALILTALQ